jgi:hypothetical protein
MLGGERVRGREEKKLVLAALFLAQFPCAAKLVADFIGVGSKRHRDRKMVHGLVPVFQLIGATAAQMLAFERIVRQVFGIRVGRDTPTEPFRRRPLRAAAAASPSAVLRRQRRRTPRLPSHLPETPAPALRQAKPPRPPERSPPSRSRVEAFGLRTALSLRRRRRSRSRPPQRPEAVRAPRGSFRSPTDLPDSVSAVEL